MRFARLFLGIGLSSSSILGQDLTESDRTFIESHFRAAKAAEASQEFGRAVEEYRTILVKFPATVPRVHHNLGLALYFDRQCEAALTSLQRADQLEPAVAATHLLMGLAHMCLQAPHKALPEFLLAHKLEPTGETAVQLGIAYSLLRQPREAIRYLRVALETGDDKETALYLLGEEYLRLAKGVAEDLIARRPNTAWDNLVIARIFDSQQFYHVAAQAYLKAVRQDPTNAATLLRMARVLALLGQKAASGLLVERYRQLAPMERERQFDEAAIPTAVDAKGGGSTDFEQEIKSLPAVNPAKLPLAPLLPTTVNELLRQRLATDRAGRWKTAIRHLTELQSKEAIAAFKGLATAPTDWLPAYLTACAYLWNGELANAETALTGLGTAAKNDPALQVLRWEIFEEIGRAHYQRLLDEYPQSARAHVVRARILDAEEKPAAAEEYKAAIAANPKQTGIRLALADHYMLNARIPEALAACQEELKIDPYSVDAKACVGRIYVDLRQPDEGLPYLQAALKALKDDPLLHSALGRLYELKGDLEKAAAQYKVALSLDPSQNKLHYLLANVYRRSGKDALADREDELFQRIGMAEREEHINFVQRYYKGGRQSQPGESSSGPR
jgi:tetratricopeptide (TPR) repeat protein